MFRIQYPLLLLALVFASCKNNTTSSTVLAEKTNAQVTGVKSTSTIKVTPIGHATMVLTWDDTVIYVDPVGGTASFKGQPQADLILVTDIHGDHLNQETLSGVSNTKSKIVLPQACADKLSEDFKGQLDILNNGQAKEHYGITITAIPMYNLREEDKNKHVKGRGNGYVLEKDGKRIYISGDTEDIPEMRALDNIDMAFVCMNLPYTMTVESAASAVLEFKPKTVYPYHYRGQNGLSDVATFKNLVNAGDSSITVTQLDWYAQ